MKKVAFVGIDGVDLDVLRMLKSKGHLSCHIINTLIPVELNNLDRGWATIFTGKDASYSNGYYWRVDNKTYSLTETFNANMYTSPPIWKELLSSSKQVGLIGIPTASPIVPLNGLAIGSGGGGVNSAESTVFFPAEIGPLLQENGYIFDLRFSDFVGKKSVDFIQHLQKVEKKRLKMLKILLDKYPDINFWAVVFTGADRIQHFFWDRIAYLIQNSQTRDILDIAIIDYYKCMLDISSELIDIFNPGTVVIASDHGFSGHTRNVHIINILADADLITPIKDSLKNKLRKTVIQLLPDTIKPRLRVLQRKVFMKGVWKLSAPQCDWNKSLVVPFKGLSGIYLNSKQNFANGIVESNMTAEVLKRTSEVLTSVQDPETGQPLFTNLQFREDVYNGPEKDTAPDIIFDLARGYNISTEVSASGDYLSQKHIKLTKVSHMPGQGHIGIHSTPACYGVYKNGQAIRMEIENLAGLHEILYTSCTNQ